ncbi:histidine--tRNA ligase [Microbacterium pumilum]
MRDFLPAEKARRERVLGVIRERYAAHGFDEIETPVVEEYSRLHAGIGGDNEKLAYNVLKRGLDAEAVRAAAEDSVAVDTARLADLGLRYDLTVPLARFYASHRAELPTVFRAIQSAPVWRAERPQKGRYRQFVQCDIDIIGDPSPRAEAELIVATLDTVDALGLEGATVRINDRRALDWMLDGFGFTAQERPGALITIDKLDKVGPEGVVAELRTRALRQAQGPKSQAQGPESHAEGPESHAQGPESQAQGPESHAQGPEHAAVDALEAFLRRPMTLEYNPYGEGQIRKLLPPEAPDEIVAHLVQIGEAVAAARGTQAGASADIPLIFDPFLVRGMGYYTGTIFELAHPSVEYSLGGGGRYDGMIGRFLGQDVPAVGFSIGFERIVDLVEARADAAAAAVVLVHDRDVPLGELLALKSALVGQGSRVRLEQRTKNLKALLERAASDGYTAFATVSSGATSETLEVKPLG